MQPKTEQPLAQFKSTKIFDRGVVYVDTAATNGNGKSWSTAFQDLQKALDQAQVKLDAGEKNIEIWVAAGIYTPSNKVGGTDERNATFQLKNNVTVYGGFNGTETELAERNWKENQTILSGEMGIENVYHVFYHLQNLNLDASAILDGVTITGGNAYGVYPHTNGGGMYNYKSSPTLRNVTFYENEAKDSGAGMYNWNRSNPTLTDVTFLANEVTRVGGGMYNLNSSPVLTNVTFRANEASDGGGMYNIRSNSPLTCVNFSGNIAKNDGGGMFNISSSPILKDVNFNGNIAKNEGGGMYNWWYMSKPTLTNVKFSGNVARVGGGIYNERSNPTLINVKFSENEAANSGSAMSNRNSNPVLTDVTFSGSERDAILGGGSVVKESILIGNDNEATLTNCKGTIDNLLDEGIYKFPYYIVQHDANKSSDGNVS